ncbi:DUF3618 domain-containing protein [Corynebacterium sp. CCM 8835]|uniref:DUF3618 domain-containing protein n=1 Tax=Corynebacterium antarcticum TaxID=2800405 RepID=A0ABS1FHS6_9CORY|nr:DUF3618 domain-containing protein [Corynebacterium antarcticum]MCK7642063.1 DUF3618 domain-containing protein [Corynebacterium antarcticum]MCK7661951.1 DUF3618 domain-containing protein [Corynebacterium antarcticum]MCL0245288.1 DUF3618 domain-containing protein [Corynebacterium antarcticum]MCX7539163.1 DUF3618 domain-containing protein [Corynebacterium antarcticum]
MARDIEDIQRELDRTRRQFASTLDQLAERSRPENIVDDAKRSATDKLNDPKVQKILAGVAGAVVLAAAFGVYRSRKKSSDLKELQRMLSERLS